MKDVLKYVFKLLKRRYSTDPHYITICGQRRDISRIVTVIKISKDFGVPALMILRSFDWANRFLEVVTQQQLHSSYEKYGEIKIVFLLASADSVTHRLAC